MRLHQALASFSSCLVWILSSASSNALAQDVTTTNTAPAASTAVASADGRPWSIGPYFGSSIMHPMTFGVDGRWTNEWGAAVSYGKFSYSPSSNNKIQDMDVTITHFEAVGSWYVWQDVFHVDAGLGRQSIDVAATSNQEVKTSGSTGDKLTLDADLGIASTYLYTGCGWIWRFASGLTLGTGLGLQLPLSSSSSFSADVKDSPILDEALKETSAYKELDKAANDAGKTAGMLAIPRIEVLRVGWLF